jgi:hypothetical protein
MYIQALMFRQMPIVDRATDAFGSKPASKMTTCGVSKTAKEHLQL